MFYGKLKKFINDFLQITIEEYNTRVSLVLSIELDKDKVLIN